MTIQDLTTTEIVDGDELNAANYNDTLNTKQSFTYAGASNTVLEGLLLTGTGAQTIDLSSGFYVGSDGKSRIKAAEAGISLTAADGSNPRYDLISINDAGTITVTDGTAAAASTQTVPATPANDTVLGYIFRDTSDNTTTDNDVADLRVLWTPAMDRIFHSEWTAIPGATNEFFQIPITNGPFTYKRFKLVVTTADSADAGQQLQFRFNRISGASGHRYVRTFTDVSDGDRVISSQDISSDFILIPGADFQTTNAQKGGWVMDLTISNSATDTDVVGSLHSSTFFGRNGSSGDWQINASGSLNEASKVTSITDFGIKFAATPTFMEMTLYGYR